MKQVIEAIDACILYSEGVTKALKSSNDNKVFVNKYNKGYCDATEDLISKLNGIRSVLSAEIDDEFTQKINRLSA